MRMQPASEPPRPVPGQLRAAVAVILLESLAMLGAAGFLVVASFTGQPSDTGRALLGAALALVASAALVYGARALLQLRAAARSPIVVLQLLALPVGYSLGIQAGRIGFGGPILLAALVVLFLLFTPPVRAVLDREIGSEPQKSSDPPRKQRN